MFGYIVMNRPEIKMKDFDMYRSFYCGLCRELRERFGDPLVFGTNHVKHVMREHKRERETEWL